MSANIMLMKALILTARSGMSEHEGTSLRPIMVIRLSSPPVREVND